MKKIAIYYRVSTKQQDDELQRQKVEAFLNAQDPKPEIVGIYSDKLSGKNTDREGYQRLVADAVEGKFDSIICYKLDRLSRSARDMVRFVLDMDDKNIGVYPVDQPEFSTLGTSPFRLVIIALLGVMADIERQNILSRCADGRAVAMANGVKFGAPKLPLKIEDQVLALRRDGKTIRQIVAELGIHKSGNKKGQKLGSFSWVAGICRDKSADRTELEHAAANPSSNQKGNIGVSNGK